jgi:hypothetical protein
MDFDWKALVGTLAPTIATALGGPLAGAGVAALSSVLLGNKDGTQDQIAVALKTADPETLLKIKQVDNDFKAKMEEMGIDVFKLEVEDRKSAREREVAVTDNTNKILAFAIIIGFLSTVGFTLAGMTKVDSVLAGTLIGYISAKAEQVLAYYFGSSRSSDRKTEIIAKSDAVKE